MPYEMQPTHKDKDFPWLSPTIFNTPKFCKAKYYLKYVLKIKPRMMTQPIATGLNAHLLFDLYYETVDPHVIVKYIDENDPESALYYIAETITSLLPDEAKDEITHKTTTIGTVIRNFCKWDHQRAFTLREFCDNPKMFIGYYRPVKREYYMEDDDSKWYGTVDLIFKLPPKYEVVFRSRKREGYNIEKPRWWVVDFKTGRPPANNKLTTAVRWQLTLYAYLWSLHDGVSFSDILISALYLGEGGPKNLKEMARKRILKNLYEGCQELRVITELGIKSNFPARPYWKKCNNPEKDAPCEMIKVCREYYKKEWEEALMKDESGVLSDD